MERVPNFDSGIDINRLNGRKNLKYFSAWVGSWLNCKTIAEMFEKYKKLFLKNKEENKKIMPIED